MRTQREKGVALITSLLVLILISAIVVRNVLDGDDGPAAGRKQPEPRGRVLRRRSRHGKNDDRRGQQFATSGSLTAANIATITATPPTGLTGITYVNLAASFDLNQITPDAFAIRCTTNATILPPSPYAGMQGLITPFTLTVAAQNAATGAEVKLTRQVQAVAIPVFQFGIYSDSDLSFFNGPSFGFGGRTHTNGNLWLAPNEVHFHG